MSDFRENCGGTYNFNPPIARRMDHDVDKKAAKSWMNGFRLAFDAGVRHPPTRADVGSMFVETGTESRFMYTDWDESDSTNRHLGFRLAREGT